MFVEKLDKINNIKPLQSTEFVNDLSLEESEQITGGSYDEVKPPKLDAEFGFRVIWGKCGADEVIGPDGSCHKY